jgi:hypothetical protein
MGILIIFLLILILILIPEVYIITLVFVYTILKVILENLFQFIGNCFNIFFNLFKKQ